MIDVPESIFDYIFKFVMSLGYLLCAKTIAEHFNLKKYLLLSVIICTIPSILFIQTIGIETIQAGIGKDDENYISTLSVTYSNMPILVLAVVNFKKLFSKKLFSIFVCSCIIAAVLYILFAYGKRGPMLWSVVSIFFCFLIKSKKYISYILVFVLMVMTFIIFLDPIIDGLKEALPKTGKKIEQTVKEGNYSGRFDTDDPKHSTYLIGLENFSRSPIWGYYFRLVTDFKHFQGAYAHNVFIEILMTMGLLGFIPFLMLLFKAYVKSRRVFVRDHSPERVAFLVIFLCVILELQTTGSCVFKYKFWFFFYVLCSLNKIINPAQPLKFDYKYGK